MSAKKSKSTNGHAVLRAFQKQWSANDGLRLLFLKDEVVETLLLLAKENLEQNYPTPPLCDHYKAIITACQISLKKP